MAISAMSRIPIRPSRISPIGVISGGAGWPQRNAKLLVMFDTQFKNLPMLRRIFNVSFQRLAVLGCDTVDSAFERG
jgi:hypothetical protein